MRPDQVPFLRFSSARPVAVVQMQGKPSLIEHVESIEIPIGQVIIEPLVGEDLSHTEPRIVEDQRAVRLGLSRSIGMHVVSIFQRYTE